MSRTSLILIAVVVVAIIAAIVVAGAAPKDDSNGWVTRDLNGGTVTKTVTAPTAFKVVDVSGLAPDVSLYTVPEGQGLKNGRNVLWHNTLPPGSTWNGTTSLEVCASTKDEGPAPDMSTVTITPAR